MLFLDFWRDPLKKRDNLKGNVAKSGMSAVQLVLLTIANLANPISINDKTHGIRYKYTHYSFLPLYV